MRLALGRRSAYLGRIQGLALRDDQRMGAGKIRRQRIIESDHQ